MISVIEFRVEKKNALKINANELKEVEIIIQTKIKLYVDVTVENIYF